MTISTYPVRRRTKSASISPSVPFIGNERHKIDRRLIIQTNIKYRNNNKYIDSTK